MRACLAILVLAVSCGTSAGPEAQRTPPPRQVTGIITELRFDGDQLLSFLVESRDATHEILIDPERDYGFNLRHLRSHRDQELPVLVQLETREGDLYAVEILDA